MEATCQRCAHTHTHAGDCGHTHDQQGTGFLILVGNDRGFLYR